MPIADLRRSYTLAGLRRADLSPDPIAQFNKWLQQAIDAQLLEPTAMTLATAGKAGRPSARIVLLKGVDERGFIFYTNYESRKGRELAENANAALAFYWPELERQVRANGTVSKLSRDESDKGQKRFCGYRPRKSSGWSELAPLCRSRYTARKLPGGEERKYANGSHLGV